MSSILIVGSEPTGVNLCGVFRNEATFFNHVDMLSHFSRDVEYHTSMLTKKQVKSVLSMWASGREDDNLVELPHPYPNFSTFTWKHRCMNNDPSNHPKSDMLTTLSSQSFFLLRLGKSTYENVQTMMEHPKTVYFKPAIASYSTHLMNTSERRNVDVMGALELLSAPHPVHPIPPQVFSPNKRQKVDQMMPFTPLTRNSSAVSYVSLLSPASVKSITSNFNRENTLSNEESGWCTPPQPFSPSFKIEFTQNYVLTPLKMPPNFLHEENVYSE